MSVHDGSRKAGSAFFAHHWYIVASDETEWLTILIKAAHPVNAHPFTSPRGGSIDVMSHAIPRIRSEKEQTSHVIRAIKHGYVSHSTRLNLQLCE